MAGTIPDSTKDLVPVHATGVRQFDVGDELVLISPGNSDRREGRKSDQAAMTLNASGSLIWDLCDGTKSVSDIAAQLTREFGLDEHMLLDQVGSTVVDLSRKSFLTRKSGGAFVRPATVFTIGIEDSEYFWWQIAILLESLEGKLPFGWRVFIVVCNGGTPISPELQNILDTYQANYCSAANHAHGPVIDIGMDKGHCHRGMNKVEALAAVAEHVDEEDVIFLLDSDIFLFGHVDLDVMPTGNALPRNYHVSQEIFLTTAPKNGDNGIDLKKLLDSMGCDREFKPGGVNIFVTGAVAKNPKFIADCFRFAHAIILLGRAGGAEDTWIAEMPCYALALTVNGFEYELLESQQLLVSACSETSIPAGTFYHYYNNPVDGGQGGFYNSKWFKQKYHNSNFLETDMTGYIEQTSSDHEEYFFQLAQAAKDRLNV